jgi:hypothetical protein
MTILVRLGKKLGLLTTPASDAAKQWAEKTRQYEASGYKLGAAAVAAARDVFHADFKPTRYDHGDAEPIEQLLSAVEQL